jgi:phosphatidylserine/phosphatidylglycerophosphate/cardiolipin synthase-like enzyme
VRPDRIVTSIEDRRSTILNVIRNARRSIQLSLFRCNDSKIVAELGRASARGVTIDALVTSRAKGRKSKLRKLRAALEEAGAFVHPYDDPVVKYHAKYLVADDGPAIVASCNFTHKCFKKTCDALVMTYDPEVVAGLRALFWADRDRKGLPAGLPSRLIIGPERARRQFTALVEQAQSSIRLIDPKVSDPGLVTLLNARRASGLSVEIFASRRVGGLKSHGKIMLIDDRAAVIGSAALAALSLDFRREVAIVVDDPGAVAEVDRVFRAMEEAPMPGGQSAASEGALALTRHLFGTAAGVV